MNFPLRQGLPKEIHLLVCQKKINSFGWLCNKKYGADI